MAAWRRPSEKSVGNCRDWSGSNQHEPKRSEHYLVHPSFSIGSRLVGAGQPCLIVAEVAQAHDGSLGAAHAYIEAIAAAGADAVKFQTHIAAAESTPAEPFRVKFSRQDATRYEGPGNGWSLRLSNGADWRAMQRNAV